MLGMAAAWIAFRLRKSPDELELQRRALVSTRGRLIEGVCTDVEGAVICYSYEWRGVEYASAQDLSAFQDLLPNPPDRLIGAITVKFLPNDPANSIIFSEQWNGFRRD